MSGTINTRAFKIEDYESAIELWQRVEGVEIAEGDDRESVAQFLKQNPGLSRVAMGGSRMIGVALCGHDGHRGHIYHLAVDPACRGKGIGKRLMQECLEGLRGVGLKRAIILVAADNPHGRAFWKGTGWEELPAALAMGIDL